MEKISVKNIPKKKHDTSEGADSHRVKKHALKTIRSRNFLNLFLGIILVLVILSGAVLIYLNTATINVGEGTPSWVKSIVSLNDKIFAKKVTVAAIVNGEQISMSDLDERFRLLPPQYAGAVTKASLLGQLIDESILMQDAQKKGITVTDSEIDAKLQEILDQNQISLENFTETIKSKNLTLDKVKGYYKRELILTKLLNQTILEKASATDSEVVQYYDANLDSFKVPAALNVSHILICHNESIRCVSNLTKEEALNLTEKIYNQVNQSNFVDFVANYSEDPSKIFNAGNLGWVSREDPFDPVFLNATFALNVSEISKPVETQFGYHIIMITGSRNAGELNIDEVRDQINQTVAYSKQKEMFTEYMSGLRNSSVISNFLVKAK